MGIQINGQTDTISAVDNNFSLAGNVSIGGTLTYEDVTSVDAVGLSTFQAGIRVTGGSVGIGTDNPGAKTHIDSTTSNTPLVVEASQNNRSRIVFRNNVETGTECNIELFDDDLRFVTNSGERLRITSAGNVGINSTIPRSKLHVANGNSNYNPGNPTGLGAGAVASLESSGDVALQFLSSTSTDNFIYFGDTDSATTGSIQYDHNVNALSFNVNGGTERLRIASAGEIFVGGSSTYNVIANYVNTAKLHLSGAGGGSANIELYGSGHATDPKIMTVNTNNIERLRITSGGSVGIGQSNPNKAKLHVVGPGTGSDEIIAKFKGGSGGDCTSKIGIVAGYSDTANDTEGHVYIGALRQGNGNQSSMIFQTDGQNTRMRIAADGSTYRGGTVITESDMYWGHDTYQRPHIFSGRVGGNPSDGAIVLASPETDPSATRIGSLVYGCKTSSASGVANSGLKAAIEGITNTNVSDAWKTGGSLRFLIRPDNGNLTVAQNIDSNGAITKALQPGFYARRTTSGDGRAAGTITEWHISGTGSYNAGNHFKTSGADAGKFVAPVSGKYYFAAQPGYKQTSNNFQFYFRINGTIVSEPVRVIDGGDDLTSHCSFTGTCIIYLTAGQKFEVYIGNTHHVNTTYCFFCGYLVG